MALQAKIIEVSIPASTTTDIVKTGAGFQVKAAIVLAAIPNVDGTGIGSCASIGFAGGNVSSPQSSGASTRDVAARTSSTNVHAAVWGDQIHAQTNTTNGDLGKVHFKTLGADGFTLEFTTGFTTAHTIQVLCLGGDDLVNASAGTWVSDTGTGTQTAKTGVGFQPNLIIFAHAGRYRTAVGSFATVSSGLGIGWATGASSRASMGWGMVTGGSTSSVEGNLRTDACISHHTVTNPQYFDLVSFDSDGFTLTKTAGNVAQAVAYLALNVTNVALGTTNAATGTGDHAPVTGLGFAPDVLLAFSRPLATATETSAQTGAQDGETSFGFALSATERAVLWCHSTDGIVIGASPNTTQAFNRIQTDALQLNLDRTSENTLTQIGALDIKSLDADGFTLTQDDADAQTSIIPWLAIGGSAAPTGRPPYEGLVRGLARGLRSS